MPDIRGPMALGGGGAASSKKSKVVADLSPGLEAVNRVMAKSVELSKSFLDNLVKAKQAGTGLVTGAALPTGGGGNAAAAMSFAPSSPAPSASSTGSTRTAWSLQGEQPAFVDPPTPAARSMSFNLGTFAKASIASMNQAIDPSTYIENDIARRRYAFFSGMGNTPGNNAQLGSGFQRMMNAGTSTDPMDAARASMSGMSNGLMPGIQQKSGVFNSVATFSNLVPGAGLEGGMQATAALQSARSVNMLRMIGVNVRDDNGMPRAFEDIAKQLMSQMRKGATGGGSITKDDLDRSLLPGNSLATMLDTYFGGDPVLRQGVITALYQMVSGQPMTKAGLKASNANPAISQNIANRNAKGYMVDNAYTTPGVEGIMAANNVLAGAAEMFANSVQMFGGIVSAMTALQTLAGGAGGAAGTFAAGTAGSFTRGARGAGSPGGTGSYGSRVKAGFGSNFKMGLKTGGILAGANLLMATPGNIEATKQGRGGSAWGNTIGATVGGLAGAALGQALIPIPVVGGLIGGMAGSWLGGMAGEAIGSSFDQGVGGDGINELFKPLSGSLKTPKDGEFGNFASFRANRHRGVDFNASVGKDVFAVKSGKATKGYSKALGNYVKIRHADGYTTTYAHLSKVNISEGESVTPGALIGLSGRSGNVTGAHLHFAVEKGTTAYDPLEYLHGSASPSSLGVHTSSSPTTSTGTVNTTSTPSSSSGSSDTSGKLFNFSGETKSLFSGLTSTGGEGGVGGDGIGGVSYGGVTVNINIPKGAHMDEHKLAREVKRILQDEEQIRMAVIR